MGRRDQAVPAKRARLDDLRKRENVKTLKRQNVKTPKPIRTVPARQDEGADKTRTPKHQQIQPRPQGNP
jgi:hypothetical protein